jgi:hypothetical protein
MTTDLIIGIAAGILTSAIVYGLTLFGRKVLGPAIRSFMYHGPDISGQWLSYDSKEPESKAVGNAEIIQKGEEITATIRRHTSRSGRSINRVFEYRGRFASGQLTLLFEDTKMRSFSTGAIVLHLSSSSTLAGKTVYFDHEAATVVAHDYWLKRSGN